MILNRIVSAEGEVSFVSPSGDYRLANLHPEIADCFNYGCLVHYPSYSPMSDFPYNWREDMRMMERICPHGVGHLRRSRDDQG